MFLYIDESGNTGSNLLDTNQPVFYYGMIASPFDLKSKEKEFLEELEKIGIQKIHTKELKATELDLVAQFILNFFHDNKLKFYTSMGVKKDLAIDQFYRHLFGMKDSEQLHCGEDGAYLTMLAQEPTIKAIMQFALKQIITDDLLQKLWSARVTRSGSQERQLIIEVCQGLLSRLDTLPQELSFPNILIEFTKYLNRIITHYDSMAYNLSQNKEELRKNTPSATLLQNLFFLKFGELNQFAGKVNINIEELNHFNDTRREIIHDCIMKINDFQQYDIDNPNIQFVKDTEIGIQIVDFCLWVLQKKLSKNNENAPSNLKVFYEKFIGAIEHNYAIFGINNNFVVNYPKEASWLKQHNSLINFDSFS